MSSPPVPVVSPPETPQPLTLVCANCHVDLAGEYCAACGQRHEPHVHTLSHFAGEAFESISHADSRLWRTLGYLLTRPGFLTREFFAGRRVSYLPPFRLYLVISVMFFLVAGPGKDTEIIHIESETTVSGDDVTTNNNIKFGIDSDDEELAETHKEVAKANAKIGAAVAIAEEAKAGSDAAAAIKDESGVSKGVRDFCDEFRDQADSTNDARNNLRDRCRQLASDGGRELSAKIVHNLPRAMFIFLPILAGIMKLLYWRPKRYYVEHLLFLLHNHAFIFLALIPLVLVSRIPYVGEYAGLLRFAVISYMIWYVFRAMRNYYGQGRGRTFAKYFTMGFVYMNTSLVVLLLTVIYSAMTG
jgi:hypothetical protein